MKLKASFRGRAKRGKSISTADSYVAAREIVRDLSSAERPLFLSHVHLRKCLELLRCPN